MEFDKNNPWFVGIIGGTIAGILVLIIGYYLFQYKEYQHKIAEIGRIKVHCDSPYRLSAVAARTAAIIADLSSLSTLNMLTYAKTKWQLSMCSGCLI